MFLDFFRKCAVHHELIQNDFDSECCSVFVLVCFARRKLLHEWWTESDENDDGDVEQGQLWH